MVIEELVKELIKNNVNMNICLIKPKVCPEGALCLKKEDDAWAVVLNERGEYIINKKFYAEHDACRFYLFEALTRPTYRIDFKPGDLIGFKKKNEVLLKKYGFLE